MEKSVRDKEEIIPGIEITKLLVETTIWSD